MLPRALKNLSLRRIKWRQPVGKLVGGTSVMKTKRFLSATIFCCAGWKLLLLDTSATRT